MKGNDETRNVTPTAEIDAYLATLPDEMRIALEALRRVIRVAAPQAVEAISYSAPAFKHRGRPLVAYGAAKNHCSFYVTSGTLLDAYQDEVKPYDTSKGTIRFTPDAPLPDALVTKLVKARIAETEARAPK